MSNSNNDCEKDTLKCKDNTIDQKDMIKKEARGHTKKMIQAEFKKQAKNFLLPKKLKLKNKFYFPKQLVKGYEGETLWFNITEDEAKII